MNFFESKSAFNVFGFRCVNLHPYTAAGVLINFYALGGSSATVAAAADAAAAAATGTAGGSSSRAGRIFFSSSLAAAAAFPDPLHVVDALLTRIDGFVRDHKKVGGGGLFIYF